MREDFTYLSSDGKTSIHAIRWTPEGNPKGVLQIIHGMLEFIARYEPFAEFLCDHGYVVTGEDHLGHGQSVTGEEELGFFGKGGNAMMIADIHALRRITEEKYPGVPYLMLGHSMGSFLVRQYIVETGADDDGDRKEVYAKGLAGAIAMGTGWQPEGTLRFAQFVSGVSEIAQGDHHRSKLLDKLVMGAYNRRIRNPRTKDDWLSKDEAVVDAYEAEPLCQFRFTVNAYYNMFKGMEICQDRDKMSSLPQGFPLLLISGSEDPVGNYGDGVRKTYMEYLHHSPANVFIKLYEDDRHEVLNETNRDVVYRDVLDWMNRCVDNEQ